MELEKVVMDSEFFDPIKESFFTPEENNITYNCDCYSCQCDGNCDCVCQSNCCDFGPCYSLDIKNN